MIPTIRLGSLSSTANSLEIHPLASAGLPCSWANRRKASCWSALSFARMMVPYTLTSPDLRSMPPAAAMLSAKTARPGPDYPRPPQFSLIDRNPALDASVSQQDYASSLSRTAAYTGLQRRLEHNQELAWRSRHFLARGYGISKNRVPLKRSLRGPEVKFKSN